MTERDLIAWVEPLAVMVVLLALAFGAAMLLDGCAL